MNHTCLIDWGILILKITSFIDWRASIMNRNLVQLIEALLFWKSLIWLKQLDFEKHLFDVLQDFIFVLDIVSCKRYQSPLFFWSCFVRQVSIATFCAGYCVVRQVSIATFCVESCFMQQVSIATLSILCFTCNMHPLPQFVRNRNFVDLSSLGSAPQGKMWLIEWKTFIGGELRLVTLERGF